MESGGGADRIDYRKRCETLRAQTGHKETFSYEAVTFFFLFSFISFCAVYPHAYNLKDHCLFDMWPFFLALLLLPSVHLCEMAVELIVSY